MGAALTLLSLQTWRSAFTRAGDPQPTEFRGKREAPSSLTHFTARLDLSLKLLQLEGVAGIKGAAAKSLQCPTLCDPRDGSPPGSPVTQPGKYK